ncbi:MAG: acetyl-CoA carboxylase biotin carboxyl carrier protein, partial [Gammaproteobacteria bacterium]
MANQEPPRVTADDLESLIELFKRSGWDEMHLETMGLELFLSNDPLATGARSVSAATLGSSATPVVGSGTPAALPRVSAAVVPDGLVAIRSPSLGTFYRAPKPGAPPYIEIGQQVETTTEVCLIEVMKLFTPVASGVRGLVREIRANDGEMVEYDDPLIIVLPN